MRLGAAVLAFAACSPPTPRPVPTVAPAPTLAPPDAALPVPAGPPGVKVTLADVGLEAGALDRTADPCVDFYQFACGGWLAANQIPLDRARWARSTALEEKNGAAIKVLLEEAAKGIGADAPTRKLGDYYASCMDDAAIEQAGTASIKALLDRISKQRDARTWLATTIELHKLGIWVVWSAHARADLDDATTAVTYLDAAGLGLPDRRYYVDAAHAAQLEGYRAHVGRMLVLAGTPATKAATAAADVLAIELELAATSRTPDEQRDLLAGYHPTDLKGLAAQVKSVDWPRYFQGVGYEPSKRLVLATPRFFGALDRLRKKFKPAQWASYFTYHLAVHAAFGLPKAFDDEALALAKLVTGGEPLADRSKRCIAATERALGEQLGQLYAAKYFPSAAQHAATNLIEALAQALGQRLSTLAWMSDATRLAAQAKLGKLVRMVGFPDKWRTYDFEVRRDDFAGNRLRAGAFETLRGLARSGKPVDRGEWRAPTYEVDARYHAIANSALVPAGILQPPYFSQERAVAANLGGLAMIVGHELVHAFDDHGAQFDGDGSHRPWWQPADAPAFAERGRCLAAQYATFEALPGAFVDGVRTSRENLADAGGVAIAFDAYRALRRDAVKVYVADGFTEDQQFFLGVGQAWCSKDRPAETQRRLASDPFAPPKFRVYGALRNVPAFAQAFRCAAGTPMSPATSCGAW